MNRDKHLLIDEQAINGEPYRVVPGKKNIDS
jgi:hypothetical protein